MVLDDHDRGRPVAFMISKHVNEDAIQYSSACPWRYSCTCPDAAKKGISCKHVHAVLTYFSPEGDMELMDYEDEVREAIMEDGFDAVDEPALPSNEVRFVKKKLLRKHNFLVRE